MLKLCFFIYRYNFCFFPLLIRHCWVFCWFTTLFWNSSNKIDHVVISIFDDSFFDSLPLSLSRYYLIIYVRSMRRSKSLQSNHTNQYRKYSLTIILRSNAECLAKDATKLRIREKKKKKKKCWCPKVVCYSNIAIVCCKRVHRSEHDVSNSGKVMRLSQGTVAIQLYFDRGKKIKYTHEPIKLENGEKKMLLCVW